MSPTTVTIRQSGRTVIEMAEDKFDKYRYDQEYIKKNMKRVLITFNRNNAQDMHLVEWMEQQPGSMTKYIKQLIRKDMEAK